MVVRNKTGNNTGMLFIANWRRPFTLPEGVFDTKRLVSDDEYKKLLLSDKLMRNKIDPKFTDLAKGHVLEQKDPSLAMLSQGMGDLKLDDGEKDSDEEDEKKWCNLEGDK